MTTVNALLELNIEFDICSDSMAGGVTALSGEALLCEGSYDTVILLRPADTTSAVTGMIERLEAAGVKTVFIDELPCLCVDKAEPTGLFAKTPDEYGVIPLSDTVFVVRCPDDRRFRDGNSMFKKMLLEVIGREKVTLDILHGKTVYTGRRRSAGAELIFIANDEPEPQPVSFACPGGMRLFDPSPGTEIALNPENGRISCVMEPYQMLVAIIPTVKTKPHAATTARKPATRIIPLNRNCSILPEHGNMLRASWSYAPNANGPAVDDCTLLPMEELRIPDRYASPGANGALVWDFEAECIPGSVLMLAETGGVSAVYVNSTPITLAPYRFWGVHNAKAEIGHLLKAGSNRIVAHFCSQDFSSPYLVPFMFLLGDFETDGLSLRKPAESHAAAPLNSQGFAHLAGNAVYRFTNTLAAADAGSEAFLSVPSLDAATLSVNGKPAGTRLWAPFDFDVSGLIKEGENIFDIRLAIPMANLMMDPMDCGLTAIPSLNIR
jgi:hypothetical protein